MQLQEAKKIAIEICYRLKPYCTKINIAGSIRRQKPEVKDIEVVCLPVMLIGGENDLFGGGTKHFYVSPDFAKTVLALGKVIKGKPEGKYMQIALPEGINLDLFIPDSFDYYRQYAIRTGSADYAHRVIAAGWLRKGWCGSDKGLRKQSDCYQHERPDGKKEWRCIRIDPELPPAWESEEAFFEWVGISYIHPSQRQELKM